MHGRAFRCDINIQSALCGKVIGCPSGSSIAMLRNSQVLAFFPINSSTTATTPFGVIVALMRKRQAPSCSALV